MTHIEAIYEGGVFRPLETVPLPEHQRVRLSIQPLSAEDVQTWWQRVSERRQQLLEELGTFPDSTPDIAEDRRR
jgi:predicted DNA-binding antitoxin AbrB/MazE fold protein